MFWRFSRIKNWAGNWWPVQLLILLTTRLTSYQDVHESKHSAQFYWNQSRLIKLVGKSWAFFIRNRRICIRNISNISGRNLKLVSAVLAFWLPDNEGLGKNRFIRCEKWLWASRPKPISWEKNLSLMLMNIFEFILRAIIDFWDIF